MPMFDHTIHNCSETYNNIDFRDFIMFASHSHRVTVSDSTLYSALSMIPIETKRDIEAILNDVKTFYDGQCRTKPAGGDGQTRYNTFTQKLTALSAAIPVSPPISLEQANFNFIKALADIYDLYFCERDKGHIGRLLDSLKIAIEAINRRDPFAINERLEQINREYNLELKQEQKIQINARGYGSDTKLRRLEQQRKEAPTLELRNVIDKLCNPNRRNAEDAPADAKSTWTPLRL